MPEFHSCSSSAMHLVPVLTYRQTSRSIMEIRANILSFLPVPVLQEMYMTSRKALEKNLFWNLRKRRLLSLPALVLGMSFIYIVMIRPSIKILLTGIMVSHSVG